MPIFISDNFSIGEVNHSDYAQRKNITNQIPNKFIGNARALAKNILEPVRVFYRIPIVPSSWYRSPKLNRKVGGSKRSQHMLGQAVDFKVASKHVSLIALARWIKENLEFDQLILECYDPNDKSKGWVHCSYNQNQNRKSILTAFLIKGKVKSKIIYARGLLVSLPKRYKRNLKSKVKLLIRKKQMEKKQ